MTLPRILPALFLLSVITSCHRAPIDLGRHFKGFDGAFVLRDLETGRTLRYNPERCAARFSPCSTFKLPHALIALDTGVASGPDHLLPFHPQRYPQVRGSWAEDHTLASALRTSAVWYFQETATGIGQTRMQRQLDRLAYGNRDIDGGLTDFWLDSSLAISPDEQVDFLTKLVRNELPFQRKHMQQVREMMVLERADGYTLHGKTGSDGQGLGWLVGYVQRGERVFVFAYNADLPDEKAGVKHRLGMVKAILRDLHVLPLLTPISYRALPLENESPGSP
ncbi:MAG: penicillin-binding transpeptidase domain-containing protein [Acidobacteriota bacterium]|nr:penicillin-binding transpeptidase domain-containing protein [Acidobacteriota bacterium]